MAAQHMDGYGDKTIGLIGSLCLLCNNICGAGMVQIPVMFQTAGWLFPLIAFLLVAMLSYYASLYLTRAVAWMPGNQGYQKRIEISGITSALLPRWAYLLSVFGLVFSFTANNIASIVISAQVMDSTILAITKKTCALVIYQETPSDNTTQTLSTFQCIAESPSASVTDSPFGSDAYVLSLGYLVIMAAAIPLAYLNLDGNIKFQVAGVALLAACIFLWCVQFTYFGLEPANMPVADPSGFDAILAGVVFNYGFVATIPSWLNEKGLGVSVRVAIKWAIVSATVLYLLIGIFGALGISPDVMGSTDVIAVIDGDGVSGTWVASKVATYVFPIANLLSSIPVFAILIRYNLMNSGICSKHVANVFSVLLPWVFSLFFYAGNQLSTLIAWSSAVLFSFINLIVPFALYIVQYRLRNGLASSALVQSINEETPFLSRSRASPSIAFSHNIGEHLVVNDETDPEQLDEFALLPQWCTDHVISEYRMAWVFIALSALLALAALALQIQNTVPS
jgi:hypothetical protein